MSMSSVEDLPAFVAQKCLGGPCVQRLPQLQGWPSSRTAPPAGAQTGPHRQTQAGINNRAIRQANDQMAITVDDRGVC